MTRGLPRFVFIGLMDLLLGMRRQKILNLSFRKK